MKFWANKWSTNARVHHSNSQVGSILAVLHYTQASSIVSGTYASLKHHNQLAHCSLLDCNELSIHKFKFSYLAKASNINN